MTDQSSRFELPYLQAGQAQKELFHNEALTRLDTVLHPVAQSAGSNDPPMAPAEGQCWIIGSAPTGAWIGQGGAIARWSEGGWRFIAPVTGMMVWLLDSEVWARRGSSGWIEGDIPVHSLSVGGVQVIGTQQPPIADPAGGAAVDAEARSAISALLDAARAHGLIAT